MSPQESKAVELLLAPDHPGVYFLVSTGERLTLSPRQCAARLKHGGYEVGTRNKRVRWIRISSQAAVWLPCWRTTRAATIWEPSWGEMET